MKRIVFLVALVACVSCARPKVSDVLSPQQIIVAIEHLTKCIDKTGIDPTLVIRVTFGDFSNSNEKVQCFAHCFFRSVGALNEKDELQEDAVIKELSLGDERIRDVVKKCKGEKGKNGCETAFKMLKCYFKEKNLLPPK